MGSIESIQIDSLSFNDSKTNYKFFASVDKLLKNFKNLETIVFGDRLWWAFKDFDIAIAFNPPASVTKLKLKVTTSYNYNYGINAEKITRICENVFWSNRFVQEIIHFRELDNIIRPFPYKRADFLQDIYMEKEKVSVSNNHKIF